MIVDVIVTVGMMIILATIEWLQNKAVFRQKPEKVMAAERKTIDEKCLNEKAHEKAGESAALLRKHLGDDPISALQAMPPKERVHVVDQWVNGLCALYGLQPPPQVCLLEMKNNEIGGFDPEQQIITINANYFFCSEKGALFRAIASITHEMFHCVQWRALHGECEEWAFGKDQLQEWYSNLSNYNTGAFNFKAYQRQPVEVTARTFAFWVMEEVQKQ